MAMPKFGHEVALGRIDHSQSLDFAPVLDFALRRGKQTYSHPRCIESGRRYNAGPSIGWPLNWKDIA